MDHSPPELASYRSRVRVAPKVSQITTCEEAEPFFEMLARSNSPCWLGIGNWLRESVRFRVESCSCKLLLLIIWCLRVQASVCSFFALSDRRRERNADLLATEVAVRRGEDMFHFPTPTRDDTHDAVQCAIRTANDKLVREFSAVAVRCRKHFQPPRRYGRYGDSITRDERLQSTVRWKVTKRYAGCPEVSNSEGIKIPWGLSCAGNRDNASEGDQM